MPVDRGNIEQQLQALGEGNLWWERLELRDLPDAMHQGETIRAIASGRLRKITRLGPRWLIVVTDQRLLCIRSGKRMSRQQLQVRAHEITRVTMGVGPITARVTVAATGIKYKLFVSRADAYKLLNALSALAPKREEVERGRWPGQMAGRVIRHVLDLPAVALDNEKPAALPPAPSAMPEDAERRLQMLEDQVHRLQQQVDFLEELLQQKQLPDRSAW